MDADLTLPISQEEYDKARAKFGDKTTEGN